MTAQDELNSAAHLLDTQATDLWKYLDGLEPSDLDWTDSLVCRDVLNGVNQTLRQVRERLDNLLAENMGTYQRDNVKRHRKVSRRNWEHDALLRMVVDSRIVDGETGEVESEVDTIKNVYGCKGYNASIRELERRGIQVDEYCQVEERGWTLEVR